MAKIVIDIPDFLYVQILKKHVGKATIARAFKNGVILPKGHGRLGDLDALYEEMVNGIRAGNFEEGFEHYANINNVDDCLETVRYADTIIKADKE